MYLTVVIIFPYKFQSFSLFRNKFGKLSAEQFVVLRENPKVCWSGLLVVHYRVDCRFKGRPLAIYPNFRGFSRLCMTFRDVGTIRVQFCALI